MTYFYFKVKGYFKVEKKKLFPSCRENIHYNVVYCVLCVKCVIKKEEKENKLNIQTQIMIVYKAIAINQAKP